MLQAAAYLRVSTADQADGISLDMQRQSCEDFARSRGWTLAHVYQDVETGRRADRPEFSQLRHSLAAYNAVIVWRLDRANRNTLECLQFLRDCQDAHCDFVSITQGFDTSTPFGRAMLAFAAALAELESDTTGERVRAARQHQLAQGKIPWGAPYGYRRDDDGRAQIELREGEIVRRIFEGRRDGASQREIAEALQADGIERRGRPWTRSAVSYVLGNRGYIGEPWIGCSRGSTGRRQRVPRSQWQRATGLLPAIVPVELWEATRRRGIRGRSPACAALLRGLLICGLCGHRMHVRSWRRNGRYGVAYICEARRRRQGCRSPGQIRESVLRGLLEEELRRLSCAPVGVQLDLPDRHDATEDFGRAHQRLERAKQLYIEGFLGHEELEAIAAQMKAAEDVVNSRLPQEATEQEVRAATAKIKEILRMKDIEAANRKLRRVVARIVVHQTEPAGVEVVLWARG